MTRPKCNHEYFINEMEVSECKHCGLLESTIKECYPDEYKQNNLEEEYSEAQAQEGNKNV